MRELTKTDIIMLDNVMRVMKQASFRNLDFDEMLGANQTWAWINKFRQDVLVSVQQAEQQKGLEAAIASAKEVTPPKEAVAKTKSVKAEAAK